MFSLIFIGKGREQETETETSMTEKCPLVVSYKAPTGNGAGNPGMCSDRELNW